MSLNFISIDFETANYRRNSACSLGVVIYDNGNVEKKEWLIKPEPCEFDPFNIMIHGITEDMVINSPTFEIVWNEIKDLIESSIVVAHNASFDLSVIRYTLEQYKIDYPEIDYLCTMKLAQKAMPGLINYKLNTVSSKMGIKLKHHNALQDANASAEILLNLMKQNRSDSLDDLLDKFEISLGKIHKSGYYPCSIAKKSIGIDLTQLKPFSYEFDDNNIFFNKNIVFTGALQGYTRAEAAQLVVDKGGVVLNGVNQKTDYLIVGEQDYLRLTDGKTSSKMKKAVEMSEKGHQIQLISEIDFWEYLRS